MVAVIERREIRDGEWLEGEQAGGSDAAGFYGMVDDTDT